MIDAKDIARAIIMSKYNGNREEILRHEQEILKQVRQIQEFLDKQKNIYDSLNEKDIIRENQLLINPENENIIFDEGTLIHCANECDYTKLSSIKEHGIMSGDFIGIPEVNHEESYFCADFYRADKRIESQEFFRRIDESDYIHNRGPFSSKFRKCSNLAFIINPNSEIEELLSSDMYNSKNSNHVMQEALNLLEDYKEEKNGQVAAIPYGIPSNVISGIVAGDLLLQNKEYMEMLNEIFPNCYIISREGKVFFDPELSKEQNEHNRQECLGKMQKFSEERIERGNNKIKGFLENRPRTTELKSKSRNLIDSVDSKIRGITLNSQHIDLFNILLNNDDRLNDLANYLDDFIDEKDEEYVRKVAIKCVNALENDGEIDKEELLQIFNDKYIKIKTSVDLSKILDEKGLGNILNKLWAAKDTIQTKPKEGIKDFQVLDETGKVDLEKTYQKVKAFFDHVTGDIQPGVPRYKRITLDGQGKFQTYRSNIVDSNNNRIYNHRHMQRAKDFVDFINSKRSSDLMSIRVNTLCFYQDFPDDLTGRKEIETLEGKRIETQEEHKTRLMEELKNYGIDMAQNFCQEGSPINIIDMFNEFINEDQTYYNDENSTSSYTLRTDGWHSVLDVEDICKVALEIKKQMPSVDFGYNDWNFENPDKRRAIFSIIKQIEEFQKDLPEEEKILTHIGMQFHTDIGVDIAEYRRIFEDAKEFDINLPFDITELDIRRDIVGLDYSKLENDKQLQEDVEHYSIGRQNKIQQEILKLIQEGKIRGVTAWSQSDEMSFLGKEANASIIDYIEENGTYKYIGKNIDLYLEYADKMPQSIIENIVENTISNYYGGDYKSYLILMQQQPSEVLEYINSNEEIIKQQIESNKKEPVQDFNFHSHTRRCGHPSESVHVPDEEYVQEALKIGLKEIAFTDHVPLPEGEFYVQSERMNYSQIDEYIKSIKSLQKKYSGLIDIQSGFEFEYAEKYESHLFELKDIIGNNGKMVLGQHWIINEKNEQQAIDESLLKNSKREEYLKDYKNSIIEAMDKGLPDVIAHPDIYMRACKEFGEIEKNIAIEICQKAIDTGVALEINLGELFPKGLNASYPSKEFWNVVAKQTQLAKQKGQQLNVVFGKDAHYTDDLSNEEIYEMVKSKLGIDTLKQLNFVKSDLKEIDTNIMSKLGITRDIEETYTDTKAIGKRTINKNILKKDTAQSRINTDIKEYENNKEMKVK